MSVTTRYTKGMVYDTYAKQVLTNASKDILEDQRRAVNIYYNRRTGKVIDSLSDNIARVSPYAGGTSLHFDYLVDLRYLDMKKTNTGKKKKVYGPVYNKILWGHFYRTIIPQLRFGLNASIEQNIINELKDSYKTLGNGN